MNAFLQNPRFKSTLSLAFFLALSFISAHAAESDLQAQQDLAAVNLAITEIQAWLLEADSTQSAESERLQAAELEISSLSQSASNIETALNETVSEIAALSLRTDRLNIEKAKQSDILQQTIRTAYMSGNQSALQVLLNEENLSESSRMLHYHKIFTESQLDSIQSFQSVLNEIASVSEQLEQESESLRVEQSELDAALERLNESKQKRELALLQLREDITSRSSELEQLEIDQRQLHELIEEINRAIADIPTSMRRSPFNEQRGNLQMPVEGEIIERYGSRYGEGDLRRQGITIGISEGTPVQAIHPGRVVFSDWLRGTGLLVIVDHGEGYMSLYGANQALAKQAGDFVDRGDIIATSGFSSELSRDQSTVQRPSVYFEIRHEGEALDPTAWFTE